MKEDLFMEFISEIKGLDWEIAAKAKKRQDSLAKPPESLGKLESISIQMAGITGKVINRRNGRSRKDSPQSVFYSRIEAHRFAFARV